ncbi:hypothetical protein L249_3107, partial [Ophiocordyceps polyrhachis-furcata BCC 54312]
MQGTPSIEYASSKSDSLLVIPKIPWERGIHAPRPYGSTSFVLKKDGPIDSLLPEDGFRNIKDGSADTVRHHIHLHHLHISSHLNQPWLLSTINKRQKGLQLPISNDVKMRLYAVMILASILGAYAAPAFPQFVPSKSPRTRQEAFQKAKNDAWHDYRLTQGGAHQGRGERGGCLVLFMFLMEKEAERESKIRTYGSVRLRLSFPLVCSILGLLRSPISPAFKACTLANEYASSKSQPSPFLFPSRLHFHDQTTEPDKASGIDSLLKALYLTLPSTSTLNFVSIHHKPNFPSSHDSRLGSGSLRTSFEAATSSAAAKSTTTHLKPKPSKTAFDRFEEKGFLLGSNVRGAGLFYCLREYRLQCQYGKRVRVEQGWMIGGFASDLARRRDLHHHWAKKQGIDICWETVST